MIQLRPCRWAIMTIQNAIIVAIIFCCVHIVRERIFQETQREETVHIYRSRPELQLKSECYIPKDRKRLPFCSEQLFRDYFKLARNFPECGRWIDGDKGFGYTEHYHMDFCQWEPYNLQNCLEEQKVKRIFMAGDSNGFQLFLSMLNLTIASGATCDLIRSEGPGSRLPNGTYFAEIMNNTVWEKAFTIDYRRCKLCRAQEYVCHLRSATGVNTVYFEFAGYYFFKDPSLQVKQEDAVKYGVRAVRNFQEFIFQAYLPRKGYPDIIFMPIPFNHEKWNSIPEIKVNLRDLSQTIRKKKATKTRVYWIPAAGEVEAKRSALAVGYKHKKFNGLLAAPYIYTLNKLAFKVLEPALLNPYSNIYGFINVANMSMQREDWNLDGIHYDYQWYSHEVRQIWSMMCSTDNYL